MKQRIKQLINGLLSIITTFLLMAAPVVAIVYAAEPAASSQNYLTYEPAPVARDKLPGDITYRSAGQRGVSLDYASPDARQELREERRSAGWNGTKEIQKNEGYNEGQ